MTKDNLYYITDSKSNFAHLPIPEYNEPYKVLEDRPFACPCERVGVGEFGYSKKHAIVTSGLRSCIALYFIYGKSIFMYHIYTVRTNGYYCVQQACHFINRTNKKKEKVIYGIVEGICPLNKDNGDRQLVFCGVEDIPNFLTGFELERKQNLMSHYVLITRNKRLIIRNQTNMLNESWDINCLPNYYKDYTFIKKL